MLKMELKIIYKKIKRAQNVKYFIFFLSNKSNIGQDTKLLLLLLNLTLYINVLNFVRFFIDDKKILFCRELLKNMSWLISVTVTLEKQLLCREGFYYKYYSVLDNAREQFTYEDYSGSSCRPAFRRLKLTKEELSRGKRYSFYIIS